jgi:hypothetical protein
MNDADFDPIFEAEVRAELRRSIVPPPTPEYVRERVERTATRVIEQAGQPRVFGRWRSARLLGGLAAAVGIVAVIAAALFWRSETPVPGPTPATGPTSAASPTPTPGPTISPGTGLHMSVTPDGGGFVYIEGDGLRVTTDYGATWSEARQVPPGDSGQDHLWDVGTLQFIDLQHGWMTGVTNGSAGARVTSYRTADGGRTWRASSVISLAPDPAAARASFIGAQDHFADALHGWIVLGRITPGVDSWRGTCQRFETSDGGATWSGPTTGSCAGISPLAQWVTRFVGYAVPDYGSSTVSVTMDGGWTWRSAGLPGVSPAQTVTVDLMAVDGSGRLTLVAAVAQQPSPHQVFLSSDGGASWSLQHDLAEPPDFAAFNWIQVRGPGIWLASVVTVAAGPDRLYETTDEGGNWTAVGSNAQPGSGRVLWWDDLRGLTWASDPTCRDYCGMPPSIFSTDDGGRTWRQVLF